MNIRYDLTITCPCPSDESTVDEYEVTIKSRQMILVEVIWEKVGEVTAEPAYQEDLTQALACKLEAKVTTKGVHESVKTTVTATP